MMGEDDGGGDEDANILCLFVVKNLALGKELCFSVTCGLLIMAL